MYRLTAKIEIDSKERWTVDFVTEVEIIRDMEKLTDECKITLPKRIRWNDSNVVPLSAGDTVRVWLGYDGNLQLAFTGYIREVGFKTPIVLVCENEMYKLKQQPTVKKAYTNVDISTLLKDQNMPCEVKVFGEQKLGQYRVTADTIASLLGHLRENGIRSFFRCDDGKAVLHVGVLFEHSVDITQVYSTGINIISDSELKQQRADTMRLKVKAISLQPNNKKIRVEVGDRDGEQRTLHTYNKSESELRAWAEQEIKRLKRDGLTGSFTTFGGRLVDKMDNVALKIDNNKMGVYQVKKNVIKYNSSGFRQEITLGQRVRE